MVTLVCKVLLGAVVISILGVVAFAIFVLPFYGVWEPLIGATFTAVLLGVLKGANR